MVLHSTLENFNHLLYLWHKSLYILKSLSIVSIQNMCGQLLGLGGAGPQDGGKPAAGRTCSLAPAPCPPQWLSGEKAPSLLAFPWGLPGRGALRPLRPHLHIQVSSGIQQHLNHRLVPTDAGVHQGGHALRWVRNQRTDKVYQAAVSLDNRRKISLLFRRLCLYSKSSIKKKKQPYDS